MPHVLVEFFLRSPDRRQPRRVGRPKSLTKALRFETLEGRQLLSAGGPYSIVVGKPLTLHATYTSFNPVDKVSYIWDINNLGNLQGAISGSDPVISWAQLNQLGITEPNSSIPINLTIKEFNFFFVTDTSEYFPEAVQLDVPQSKIIDDWNVVYHDTYSIDLPVSAILPTLTGPYTMLAARQTGSPTIQLLAWAPTADVIFNTGKRNDTHLANRVNWYFEPQSSWGFAPEGDEVNRNSADNIIFPDGDMRLSWHTGQGAGGYRAGSIIDLNTSTDYERLIYQSDGPYKKTLFSSQLRVLPLPSTIVGRQLFYGHSPRYDIGHFGPGNNSQTPLLFSNDNAIARDKVAYLPNVSITSGGTLPVTLPATFANISSYSLGINGMMIDLAGAHGSIGTSDFIVRMGNNNSPETWSAAPAPAVLVRPRAGINTSDRVELVWPDNAIQKTWLEVIVKANANTGLAAPDTFFFGSAVGDSVADSTNAKVDINDQLAVRNNAQQLGDNIPLTNVFDHNRDGVVDRDDELLARSNQTVGAKATQFIRIGIALSPSVAVDVEAGIASALATRAVAYVATGDTLPGWLPDRLDLLAATNSDAQQSGFADYYHALGAAPADDSLAPRTSDEPTEGSSIESQFDSLKPGLVRK